MNDARRRKIMSVKIRIGIILLSLGLSVSPAHPEELLLNSTKIIPAAAGQIPQAPRVSPDGRAVVFEYYSRDRVSLWHASADGKGAHCLTCEGIDTTGPAAANTKASEKEKTKKKSVPGVWHSTRLENAYWHPSGNYIVFNEVPDGNIKTNAIYSAAIREGRLGQAVKVAQGARPQFSRPNGHVIFFETSRESTNYDVYRRIDNILAYQVLGRDPLNPLENMHLELRGPIQQVNESAEISHPSLAPDGTTIVFAARTTSIKSDQSYQGIVLNDIDRQKIYKLWQALISVDQRKIRGELARLGEYNKHIPQDNSYEDSEGGAPPAPPQRPAVQTEEPYPDSFRYIISDEEFLSKPTVVPGFTRRHFYFAYLLGLLSKLDTKDDLQVQELIYPRLWTTDVFGAPVVPLVKDMASTPLPQKWPTVSHDGKFVVFEAGHYTNRHIYLVAKKKEGLIDKAAKLVGRKPGDEWSEQAIKITEMGTYNSSPELDPTGEWLYFESNRDGTKGIWRAKLDWPEINKKLGYQLR